jgi:LysR family glycine cleavage system transcriptional activator
MARNLPSPIALRAFEAAARHLSFTRAADDLNVTQAAVSHQIKLLENHLGFPLFTRLTRRLLLTNEGQILYASVYEAFDQIEGAIEKLTSGIGDQVLTVSLTPYFSSKWLTVRLSQFWALHPNIDLRLHHSLIPGQFDQSEIDLAITWGLEDWPDLDSKQLMVSKVVPVCSPGLVNPDRPLSSLDDLCKHTLLHENDYSLWTLWLERAGVKNVRLKRGSTMDDSNVLLQAAIDGQGVALGSDFLCADDLDAGKLMMPFPLELAIPYSYYIVYKPGALSRPKINAFYHWLLSEAESSMESFKKSREPLLDGSSQLHG